LKSFRRARDALRRSPSLETVASIPGEILEQLVRDWPTTAGGIEALGRQFKKALIERALGAGLSGRRSR
jgi:hypothetical protein